MHGLISHLRAKPGRRDDMVAALTGAGYDAPGLLAFHVAHDPGHPDQIWVTEVWADRAAYDAAMAQAMASAAMAALMDCWDDAILRAEVVPVAGKGL
jgi:quinol monooxygenase YgiN